MAIVTTFYQSGTFTVSASKTIDVSCWGAGGDGNKDGTGGSGGAYCAKTFTVKAGTYTVNVGVRNDDGFGNGGFSNFISASIIVQAGGGRSDGTITGQDSYNTGSTTFTGGLGGSPSSGYENYNGGSGGSAAGGLGNGITGNDGSDGGASFSAFGHSVVGALGASGAAAGGGNGGNSAYYDSGPCSRVVSAQDGDIPGGGGGGGYRGETNVPLISEGRGADGMVQISW
jgi:hypothetical protein